MGQQSETFHLTDGHISHPRSDLERAYKSQTINGAIRKRSAGCKKVFSSAASVCFVWKYKLDLVEVSCVQSKNKPFHRVLLVFDNKATLRLSVFLELLPAGRRERSFRPGGV